MLKRIIALLLGLCLLYVFSPSAFASGPSSIGEDSWELDEDGVMHITGGPLRSNFVREFSGGLSSPSEIVMATKHIVVNGYVPAIYSNVFAHCPELLTVTLPDSLTSIGQDVFSFCPKLESVYIPDSVREIGSGTFSNCPSLKNVRLPAEIDYMGDSVGWEQMFAGCISLEALVIPEGVTRINGDMLYNCTSLKSLTIPASVTEIEEETLQFLNNCKLTTIKVAGGNKNYTSVDNVLMSKDRTELLLYPAGSTNTSYTVPTTVRKIYSGAFQNNDSLQKIVLPANLREIGEFAFRNCSSLTQIKIPDSVDRIPWAAFMGASSLKVIEIPKSVRTIGREAFAECTSLERITIPANVDTADEYTSGVIAENTFRNCTSLKSVVIGDVTQPDVGPESIAVDAFSGCTSLKSITLTPCVMRIADGAFMNCAAVSDIYYSGAKEELTGKISDFFNRMILEGAVIHCRMDITDEESADGVVVVSEYDAGFASEYKSLSSDEVKALALICPESEKMMEQIGCVDGKCCAYSISVHDLSGKDADILSGSIIVRLPIPEEIRLIDSNQYDFGIYCFRDSAKPEKLDAEIGDAISFAMKDEGDILLTWEKKDVIRLSGTSRVDTAVKISEGTYESAECVIIASGDDFADALAGAPLAYALKAPILLVRSNGIQKNVYEEIERLGADKVYILGGSFAVSETVAEDLRQKGCEVERLSGGTRFETAVKIAEKLEEINGKAPDEIFFAYYYGYADALAASSAAAVNGSPILYINGEGELHSSVAEYLRENSAEKAVVLGGELVVSSSAEGNIRAAGISEVTRLCGKSRYDTCVKINEAYSDILNGDAVCIATGLNYPDALAGGVFAARNNAPLVLVGDNLTGAPEEYIRGREPDTVYIFGGETAVSAEIENEIAELVQ